MRVIAGKFESTRWPAATFSAHNLWHLRLKSGAQSAFNVNQGDTALMVVLPGSIMIEGQQIGDAEIAVLSRDGSRIGIAAASDTRSGRL